jgi:hypothetical protein
MAFGWIKGLPNLLGVYKRAHVMFLFSLHTLDRPETGLKSRHNADKDDGKKSHLHEPWIMTRLLGACD